jgi:hypothetical protein
MPYRPGADQICSQEAATSLVSSRGSTVACPTNQAATGLQHAYMPLGGTWWQARRSAAVLHHSCYMEPD